MGNADVKFMGVKKLNILVAEISPSKKYCLRAKRRKIRSCLLKTVNKKNNCTLCMGMANLLFQKCEQGKYFPILIVTKTNE